MIIPDIFDFDTVSHPLAPGKLLVASPTMGGSDLFGHTVVTLVNYSPDEGAMGLVMNNPLEGVTLEDALPNVKTPVPVPLFSGGPVGPDRLFFLHTLPDIFTGSEAVGSGLYVSGNFDAVLSYVKSGYPVDERIRFFVGYSGWSAGQLEQEVKRKWWAVAPGVLKGSAALVGEGDAYWHRVVRLMGEPYRPWLRHPKNPSLN